MISVDTALALIETHRPDWGYEDIPLRDANNRILAKTIISPFDQPRVSISIMDGYAVRKSDLMKELNIVGESRAGAPFKKSIKPGQAVRIFTGAIVPQGADYVEIQENARADGSTLTFPSTSNNRHYIREAGSDFLKNTILFETNTRVTPAIIITLATVNISHISVFRRPTVGLLRSGDELRPLGTALDDTVIIDALGPALIALMENWAVPVVDLGIVADDPIEIKSKIESNQADIVVTIGGASVGDYDFMKSVCAELGASMIFDTVAIKPGKPSWFAKKEQHYVLGLPGNPSSAWVCAHIFLKHLLGLSLDWTEHKTSIPLPDNGGREMFLRGKLNSDGTVQHFQTQDSGLVLPLAEADVLIRRAPFADEVSAGASVMCLPLA